jgi:rare lipoprotein A
MLGTACAGTVGGPGAPGMRSAQGSPPAPASGSRHGTDVGPSPTIAHGKASYYADSLAGNATASGEPYDPAAFTAAHRSLPFGTWVDVVRRDGRWVRVRINDRGPFTKGRVIDLSRRAAEAIGMIRAGVVDVTLHSAGTHGGGAHSSGTQRVRDTR